ncbi:MAG: AAA family ATPase [Bacilli bacterium]
MNKIIVITGDLASGKSTLADHLKERFHFLCLKKDSYKELICNEIGFANRQENLKISHLTMNLLLLVAKQAMEEGINIIFEANFHANELAQVNSLINQFHYQSFFINLTAEMKVLYQRFLDRVPLRHAAHLSGHLQDSFLNFKQYIEQSRDETKDYLFHYFDTTNKGPLIIFDEVLYVMRENSF